MIQGLNSTCIRAVATTPHLTYGSNGNTSRISGMYLKNKEKEYHRMIIRNQRKWIRELKSKLGGEVPLLF